MKKNECIAYLSIKVEKKIYRMNLITIKEIEQFFTIIIINYYY